MASKDFVGDRLRGDPLHGDHEYLIRSHEIRDDFLDVFLVQRTDNTSQTYEAQAFAKHLPRENEGLYQTRRRRMKRIFRSKNFEQEILQGDRRFLISRVERNAKDWRDLRAQVGGYDGGGGGGVGGREREWERDDDGVEVAKGEDGEGRDGL